MTSRASSVSSTDSAVIPPMVSSHFCSHCLELSSPIASSHETHTLYSCVTFFFMLLCYYMYRLSSGLAVSPDCLTGLELRTSPMASVPSKSVREVVNTLTSLHYFAVKTVFFYLFISCCLQAPSHIHFSCDILHHSRES